MKYLSLNSKYYRLSDEVFVPPTAEANQFFLNDDVFEIDKSVKQILKSLPLRRGDIDKLFMSSYDQQDIDALIEELLQLNVIEPMSLHSYVWSHFISHLNKKINRSICRLQGIFGVYMLIGKCYIIKRKLQKTNIVQKTGRNNGNKKVLLIGFGGIGDMVLMTPMLQALTEAIPGVSVDVITKSKYVDFFKTCPLVNCVIKYPGNRRVYKWVGKPSTFVTSLYRQYDITIGCCEHFGGTCRWFTGKALSYLIDANMRIGTLDKLSRKYFRISKYFLTHGIEERYEHEAKRMLRLLEPFGTVCFRQQAKIWSSVDSQYVFGKLNLINKINSRRYLIGISPFSGIAKQWPIDRYAKLIKILLTNLDTAIVLLGTKRHFREASILRLLVNNANLIDLTGQTSTKELVAIIGSLSLLVSPDSGPAHIAAACQVPEVVLFGYTNPYRYHPWMNEALTLIRMPSRNIKDINVDVVYESILKLLKPGS